MNRNTPIGDFVSLLKREIADRQALLATLEPLLTPPPRSGVGRAAVEILREAGRPMHGLREIVPALEAKGFEFKTQAGFATTLLRTGYIRRTAPGTFAYDPKGDLAEAPD